MQNQRGFTLIELIIVIVILGILAVTAAPRFIDLQSDAKESTLSGVKSAMQGGSQLVYAKAAIAGEQNKATSTISLSTITSTTAGETAFAVVYGYPDGDDIAAVQADSSKITNADLLAFAELNPADFTVTGGTNSFIVTFNGDASTVNCRLEYANSTGPGIAPVITLVNTDC